MAKRFTDTNKYKKPFIRGLQGAYKLLWDYLYHDCDHAGIWIVDFDIAQIYIGLDMPINKKDAIKNFNNDEKRIIEFDKNKWFIPSFIEFQYGELNEKNRAHNSVISILKKNNLYDPKKGLIRVLKGYKDKDKDKKKDKEQLKDIDINYYRIINTNKDLKLTEDEFLSLIKQGYNKERIDKKLDDIENSKSNKKYFALKNLLINWYKNEFGEVKNVTTNENSRELQPNLDREFERIANGEDERFENV